MTIFQCAARVAVMLGIVLVSACATSYAPQLYLSATADVQCPGNTVLMCKNVDAAQECGCASRATFWAD